MTAPAHRPRRVALLLSVDSFEKFYGGHFGIGRDEFGTAYQNDFVWEYSKGLRRRGHEIFIYVLSFGPEEVRTVAEGIRVRFLHMPSWLKMADKVLYRSQVVFTGRVARERCQCVALSPRLKTAMAADGIDVLYVQELWTHRFDRLMASISSVPVIGADHGARYFPALDGAKRVSFPRAYKLTCQTKQDEQRVRALGGDPVVLSNGVDTDVFRPGGPAEDRGRTILAVGRLVEEQKRYRDLVIAMESLPEFTLTIVGAGPDEAVVRRQIERSGVGERVRLEGFVSDRARLRQWYQTAGVFVSSSLREAYQLTMLEAMACGAPVVGTRIPTFLELIDDGANGMLVDVGAPAQIAAAVRRAYQERASLSPAARRTIVVHHSSADLFDRLSALIEAA